MVEYTDADASRMEQLYRSRPDLVGTTVTTAIEEACHSAPADRRVCDQMCSNCKQTMMRAVFEKRAAGMPS